MGTDEDADALKKAQGRRLMMAREHWRLPTATAGAKFLRQNTITYSHHENGRRGMGRKAAEYAAGYGVPEEWLLRGKNPPEWARSDVEPTAEERRGGADHFLRPWRLYRNLTVADLADRIHAPPDMIEAWESGAVDISGKALRRLAAALDTTAGSILDFDPESVPQGVLELWRDTAAKQRDTQQMIADIRRIAAQQPPPLPDHLQPEAHEPASDRKRGAA